MADATKRARLAEELEKSRKLLAGAIKPFLPDIPLEKRLDLAQTLNKDENIDYLAAQIRLRRPIADETPPWEDDPDLLEWLESEEDRIRSEALEREHAAEIATARLKKAEWAYEQYETARQAATQSSKSEKSDVVKNAFPHKSETMPAQIGVARPSTRVRRSLSKDDIRQKNGTQGSNRKSSGGTPALRRRPSFLADTPQSQIEVHVTCSNCRVNNEAIIHAEDLAAIVQPQGCPTSNIVTSTPHGGKRLRAPVLLPDAWKSEALFSDNVQVPPPLRRCSSVHFDDEKFDSSKEQVPYAHKDRTFDIGGLEDRGEKENRKPQGTEDNTQLLDSNNDEPCATDDIINRTVVKGDPCKESSMNKAGKSTTVVKKTDVTVIKDRAQHSDNLKKSNGPKSTVPRIAQPRIGGPSRGRTAANGPAGTVRQVRSPTRGPAVSSATSRIATAKPVLPSKTSALPSERATRRLLGGMGTRDVGSTRSGVGTGFRPSKPAGAGSRVPQANKKTDK
ncbi:hypothetical protein BIW11_07248 [Tropilaelaps mercedesae]|uniref:Uncharacterized protein n=1 Tax=Tropilaelaps mercedesae TaxID=418985 RepID=A0A1V9XUR7_9ACAR|nr:hypothetical protein BIW11_07248 [Tropilaelaps mercedesae]